MNTGPGAFDPDPGYRGDAPGLKPKIPVGAMNLIVTDPPFTTDFNAPREGWNSLKFEVVF